MGRASPGFFDTLSRHAFFQTARPETLARLRRDVSGRSFARGQTIFSQFDNSSEVYGIARGSVRISATGLDGKEAVFNVVREGDIFGEIAALDGRSRTADATAITDCQLACLSRQVFVELLRDDPDLSGHVIALLCDRLRRTTEQAEDVMILDAGPRLARALLRLRTANELTGGRVQITQHEIANAVGLTREITNKYLRRWQSANLLRLERGAVTVVDPVRLADMIE